MFFAFFFLMSMLVQLELALVDRTPGEYMEFVEQHLVPMFGQLANRLNQEVFSKTVCAPWW